MLHYALAFSVPDAIFFLGGGSCLLVCLEVKRVRRDGMGGGRVPLPLSHFTSAGVNRIGSERRSRDGGGREGVARYRVNYSIFLFIIC